MLNNVFTIVDNQLCLTKTGERITDYEPVFILRGSDTSALAPLVAYQGLMPPNSKAWWTLETLNEAFREFRKQFPEEMKPPTQAYGEE